MKIEWYESLSSSHVNIPDEACVDRGNLSYSTIHTHVIIMLVRPFSIPLLGYMILVVSV